MRIIFAAIGSEIISIEALSAVLKSHGHTCGLAFDRGMFDDKQYFSIPFLARLLDDRAQVIRDIVEFKPDLVAFSVMADNFQWCLEIAARVKEKLKVPVIMGGVHPTSVPDACIAAECVDIVCQGEGEFALLELVESMKKGGIDYGIRNLWFKKNGAIIRNPPRPLIQNLDALPMIDKELFEGFIDIPSYYLTVTNKGCIAQCAYCSQNFYARWEGEHGLRPFYRERSVESVIGELLVMKQRYHFKRVDIKNNVLAASKEWTREFCLRYKAAIGVPFRIMGHPRTIDRQIARTLKDAGCWHVQIGVESLNPEVRSRWLNRHETNVDIYQALDAMDEAGLDYSVDVMVGLPGETEGDIAAALELFSGRRHLIRASIFWLKYLPAVDITERAFGCGLIGHEDIDKIQQGLQPNYLSTGSVENKQMRDCLLSYQVLFRILPIISKKLLTRIVRRRYHRFCRYLPQIPLIIFIDVLVSIVRRDRWALYAIDSYRWELVRRLKRFFGIRTRVHSAR